MATDNEQPVDTSIETEATDEVTPDTEDAVEETPAAAAVPSFGLLFQPPTPVAAPPRRRAPAPEPDPEDRYDEGTDEDDSSSDEQHDQRGDDDSSPHDGGRRRRRRGGRGRNTRSEDESNDSSDTTSTSRDDSTAKDEPDQDTGARDSADDSSQDDSSDEDQGEQGQSGNRGRSRGRGRGGQRRQRDDSDDRGDGDSGPSDDDDSTDDDDANDDDSNSSRRRRRRRRGGSSSGGSASGSGGGGNGGQDDPPGTVTKVRDSRRTEPQAIKGSTRLEAKKQRRREGREAGRRRTIITEAEFLARRESVERVMVVRQQGDRTQIGVLEDGVLVEHYVSRETTSSMVGNVYLGRVQNVLPSMEAAFIDIGKGRNAVLYAGEVNWEAQGVGNGQARRIENALASGDSVLVQVTKDPIGHKGARLTSQISLPGRYLVYVPDGNMTGISRKLPDTERTRLKGILKEVVPNSAGVIVRTAAEGASEQELTSDVERLTTAWEKVSAKAEAKQGKKNSAGGAPTLLHAEPDMTVRVIRDIFNEDFAKMVVSGEDAWREIKGYVDSVAPDLVDRLEKWTGGGDVFAEHRIDEAIAKAMDRKVWLPSGGSLVIDRTEAMTVVDVNTGKFIGAGGNLEETVTKNNLEAAEEIVRQLRLRDIGGIIVVDFIDMVLETNRDLVVRRLLECLGRDRTKHQVAEVTSLGLVQMTRKRVGSGLIEVFSQECEHCHGRGILVHSEPVAHDPGGHGPSSGGGSSAGSSDGGRSRRGRGKGGNDSEPQRLEDTAEETDANGRTAAQIAAAAHAAAIKSIAGEPGEDDVADLAPPQDEPAAVEDAEPAPTRRRGGRRAASSSGTPVALEPVDLTGAGDVQQEPVEEVPEPQPEAQRQPEQEQPSEPEQAPQAPTRRRGGRRAASSSGAPVALEPVDLTAAVESDSAPITKIAGESGEAPTTPVADPEPSAPARRKRKRVTADAGPPKADETSD